MKIRVYYEDTDLGGVVYYANYLKFCERARSEAFFSKGLSPVVDDGHFMVKEIKANYISSAKLGDLLDVKTELLKVGGASFELNQKVFKGDLILFEMDVKLVYVDSSAKPKRLTKEIKDLLNLMFG